METLEPILKAHPFLTDLKQEHFNVILGCASNVRFKEGEVIFREGQEANKFVRIALRPRRPAHLPGLPPLSGASYVHFASGADMIVCISAAPGRGVQGGDAFATTRMWELMGEAISYFSTAFVVYANRVGIEDGVTFAGGSFVFAPGGRLAGRAVDLDRQVLVRRVDLDDVRDARRRWLFKRDEKPEVVLRSLERALRAAED